MNVTRDVAGLLVSSSSSILAGRVGQCDNINYCRTLWNIIWSCLITIFACIWVAIHPNITPPRAPPKNRLERLAGTRRGLGERLAMALLSLLAPEFIFVWALRQWLHARSTVEDLRLMGSAKDVEEARKQRQRAEQDCFIAREAAELQYLRAQKSEDLTTSQRLRFFHLTSRAKLQDARQAAVQETKHHTSEFLLFHFTCHTFAQLF